MLLLFYFYSNTNKTHKHNSHRKTAFGLLSFSVTLLGAMGGLLVAATLKYADAILKTLGESSDRLTDLPTEYPPYCF